MLDQQDFNKLKEIFATKGELGKIFDEKLDPLIRDISVLKTDMKEVKEEVAVIKENVQGVIVSVDGLAKSFEKLDHEYLGLNDQVNRHEKWHHQVAEKVGITLEVQ